ncbi:MAG: hypothetical protein IJW72_00245 [Alphaproteobacteria bacterium]|nr:hypothetical protein [Alphaproteobacteria bacterium]
MTNLTEQWKKGKLDHGWYYIKYRGAYKTDQWQGYYWENSWNENVEEVIAPVPSYDDWVYLHKARNDAHEIVESLTQENQQLKELLRECKTPIDLLIKMNIDGINGYKLLDLLTKIDNAIGEKK